jgi:beta-glucosidase
MYHTCHILIATAVLALCGVENLFAEKSHAIDQKDVHTILKQLTLEQKARLLSGSPASDIFPSHITAGAAGWTYSIPELGIPALNLADGPVGPRINPMPWIEVEEVYDDNGIPVSERASGKIKEDAVTDPLWCTAFPSTTALAATFDREAAREQGVVMGRESQAYGIDVLLTPGVNIMRNPLCGRNFEYYSEDPFLAGSLACEVIKGIQLQGVGTSLKHFVANNQQTGKKYNDARIDRRALREIYLKPFEICVRNAHPWTVMPSYNLIGGTYTQTNRELMQTLLRDEWGFNGVAVTDWFVHRPAADLIKARTALIMPGSNSIVEEILQAVKTGAVSEAEVDSCVVDVLRLAARSLSAKGWSPSRPNLQDGAALSRRIGAEAMVLLKNNGRVLPLNNGAKVALFGTSAYQSLPGGTGSSNVNKAYVVDIDCGLANAGFEVDSVLSIIYHGNNAAVARLNDKHPQCPEWQKISYHRPVIPEMDLSRAGYMIESRAKENDVAVVVLGRESGETSDRRVENDFNITDAERDMITSVCNAFHSKGKPVVVVLNVCGVIETASWKEMPDAIVLSWFPGQECGDAVADVLSGKVNPSGRLPMTFPMRYEDTPSAQNYPYVGQTSGRNFDYTNYEESIWVGYRWFEKSGREVSYPFGYGQSYTDFEYTDVKLHRKGDKTTVSLIVTNIGDVAGREVVQLYVSAPAKSMTKPAAELRGFAKTRDLAPGASEKITITVSDDELASFDETRSAWVTEPGGYTARIGRCSGSYVVNLPFNIKREKVRNVNDILAPVAPLKLMDPTASQK